MTPILLQHTLGRNPRKRGQHYAGYTQHPAGKLQTGYQGSRQPVYGLYPVPWEQTETHGHGDQGKPGRNPSQRQFLSSEHSRPAEKTQSRPQDQYPDQRKPQVCRLTVIHACSLIKGIAAADGKGEQQMSRIQASGLYGPGRNMLDHKISRQHIIQKGNQKPCAEQAAVYHRLRQYKKSLLPKHLLDLNQTQENGKQSHQFTGQQM